MKKLSKIFYWVLSLTWGLPMTLLGLTIAVVLLCCGKKLYHHVYGWVCELGPVCGGFSLGPFIFAPVEPSERLLSHEFGHSIQNCYLGPFMPLLVSIPSMVRFWYREIMTAKGKFSKLPPYDSIWFEGQATQLGNMYHEAQIS